MYCFRIRNDGKYCFRIDHWNGHFSDDREQKAATFSFYLHESVPFVMVTRLWQQLSSAGRAGTRIAASFWRQWSRRVGEPVLIVTRFGPNHP